MHLNRPGVREAIASVACLVIVFVALVALDHRVRDRFDVLVSRASAGGVNGLGAGISSFGSAVVQAARDKSIDQAPLLVFTVVGGGLLFFMLRT